MELATDNFMFVPLKEWLKINKGLRIGKDKQIELAQWVKAREYGRTCSICGNTPIWAAGSFFMGDGRCFTCMTGEADASNDYDIE